MSLAQVLSSSYADSLQPKVYNYRQTSGPTNQPRLFHSIHPSTQLQRRKQISRTTETIASLGETGEEKGRGITACWPRRRRWWRARPPGCSAWRRRKRWTISMQRSLAAAASPPASLLPSIPLATTPPSSRLSSCATTRRLRPYRTLPVLLQLAKRLAKDSLVRPFLTA